MCEELYGMEYDTRTVHELHWRIRVLDHILSQLTVNIGGNLLIVILILVLLLLILLIFLEDR